MQGMRKLLIFLIMPLFLSASQTPSDAGLKQQIGRMIIIGFDADRLDAADPFVQALRRYRPGGVILFDRDYRDRNRTKNIASAQQLAVLTAQLRSFATAPLLISVDQEGGKVARLKPQYGFPETPSAAAVGDANDPAYAAKVYGILAATLQKEGINTDFAPVVDLAINPKNTVIVGLGRSYGASPEKGSSATRSAPKGSCPCSSIFPATVRRWGIRTWGSST